MEVVLVLPFRAYCVNMLLSNSSSWVLKYNDAHSSASQKPVFFRRSTFIHSFFLIIFFKYISMRCSADNSLVASDKKETIKLYVTTTSFVLVKDDKILEIHFDGHKMTRRGKQHKLPRLETTCIDVPYRDIWTKGYCSKVWNLWHCWFYWGIQRYEMIYMVISKAYPVWLIIRKIHGCDLLCPTSRSFIGKPCVCDWRCELPEFWFIQSVPKAGHKGKYFKKAAHVTRGIDTHTTFITGRGAGSCKSTRWRSRSSN